MANYRCQSRLLVFGRRKWSERVTAARGGLPLRVLVTEKGAVRLLRWCERTSCRHDLWRATGLGHARVNSKFGSSQSTPTRSNRRAFFGHNKRGSATRATAMTSNLTAVDRAEAAVGNDARAMQRARHGIAYACRGTSIDRDTSAGRRDFAAMGSQRAESCNESWHSKTPSDNYLNVANTFPSKNSACDALRTGLLMRIRKLTPLSQISQPPIL